MLPTTQFHSFITPKILRKTILTNEICWCFNGNKILTNLMYYSVLQSPTIMYPKDGKIGGETILDFGYILKKILLMSQIQTWGHVSLTKCSYHLAMLLASLKCQISKSYFSIIWWMLKDPLLILGTIFLGLPR